MNSTDSRLDENKDGSTSFDELWHGLLRLGLAEDKEELAVRSIIKELDADGARSHLPIFF